MLTALLFLALSFDVRSSADDSRVFAILQQMARSGAERSNQTEIAAFLVRDAGGAISSVPWPQSGRFRSESYRGVIPAGTVALAHTHPWQADQRPSQGDVEQAKKIGLPIYVVTRWNLYVVDAAGNVIELFARTDWTRSTFLAASK
jgi:hypothetical protein